jgi:hypothetical protein
LPVIAFEVFHGSVLPAGRILAAVLPFLLPFRTRSLTAGGLPFRRERGIKKKPDAIDRRVSLRILHTHESVPG